MNYKGTLTMLRREKIKRILVTGPYRSGTAFVSYCLARALKSVFFHQSFYEGGLKKFISDVAIKENFVCHGSALLPFIRRLPANVLIIVIERPLYAILESQHKAGVDGQGEKHYFEQEKIFNMNDVQAHIKYQWIEKLVARDRRIEYIDYESLEGHPLFVKFENRRKFTPAQILRKGKTPKTQSFIKE